MNVRLLLSLSLLGVGCSTAEDPASPRTDAAPDTAVADAADETSSPKDASDAAIGDTMATDDAPEPDTAILEDTSMPEAEGPIGPFDCLADDFGPSSTSFVDFLYQKQVGACEASSCSDFWMFDTTCKLTYQHADVAHEVTLEPEPCARLTRWLTSDVLVKHLRDTVTCYGAMIPGKFESTQLNLGDGPASKKTFLCEKEPFVSHRACLDKLHAAFFPGI